MKINEACLSRESMLFVSFDLHCSALFCMTTDQMDHLWETHGRRLSEAGLRRGSGRCFVSFLFLFLLVFYVSATVNAKNNR